MKKIWFLIGIIFITIILMLVNVLFLIPQKLVIFPNPAFIVFSYSDIYDGGKSKINQFIRQSNSITMTYTLQNGYIYPYAGISFNQNQLFSIKAYDRIALKIKSTRSKSLKFLIRIYLKNHTSEANSLSYLYLIEKFPVTEKLERYVFNLEDIKIPTWWYELNKVAEFDKGIQKDFTAINSIQIESDNNQPTDLTDTITIAEFMVFKSRNTIILIISLLIFMLTIIIYFIFQLNRQRILPYKLLTLKNYADEETRALLHYLGEHYMDSDLTVEKVCHACGVSVLKIPQIIKKNFNQTFPQYLNTLRINEAKRILVESDQPVTEIALSLGYNNITHFNKIFKNFVQISPREYRKRNRMLKNR